MTNYFKVSFPLILSFMLSSGICLSDISVSVPAMVCKAQWKCPATGSTGNVDVTLKVNALTEQECLQSLNEKLVAAQICSSPVLESKTLQIIPTTLSELLLTCGDGTGSSLCLDIQRFAEYARQSIRGDAQIDAFVNFTWPLMSKLMDWADTIYREDYRISPEIGNLAYRAANDICSKRWWGLSNDQYNNITNLTRFSSWALGSIQKKSGLTQIRYCPNFQ